MVPSGIEVSICPLGLSGISVVSKDVGNESKESLRGVRFGDDRYVGCYDLVLEVGLGCGGNEDNRIARLCGIAKELLGEFKASPVILTEALIDDSQTVCLPFVCYKSTRLQGCFRCYEIIAATTENNFKHLAAWLVFIDYEYPYQSMVPFSEPDNDIIA